MAVLTHPAQRQRARLLFACLLGAAGCVLFGTGQATGKKFAFPHKVHVDDEAMDCTDCHLDAETADDPGMPALGGCVLCHKEIDAEKPADKKVEVFFADGKFLAAHASELGNEILFSHSKHVAKVGACDKCHAGIAKNEVIDASVAVEKPACLACHAENDVSGDCATCHTQISKDRPPRTHDGQWLRYHGKTVRAESPALVDRCDMCHEENSCQTCHQVEPPTNHNNFFRRRGHGLMARMDRDNCAACHRPDSCDACHRQVLPQSHVGNFGGTQSTHCFSCHLPLESSDCATCHRDTPSHSMAAPLPQNHSPSMNCRQCHGLSAPLPHVDKGDQCTACHR
ncbi:MAG: cytochrome c3 family protein [Planctomycetota bacterium]